MKKLLTASLLMMGVALITSCGEKVFDENNTLGEKPQQLEGAWLDLVSYENYQKTGDLLKGASFIELFEIKDGFVFSSGTASYVSHKTEKLQRPLMIKENGQAVAVDIYSDTYKTKLESSCEQAKEDFNATNARNANSRFVDDCIELGEEIYNKNLSWSQETAPNTVYSIPEEGLLKRTVYNPISRKLPSESQYFVRVDDGLLEEIINKTNEFSDLVLSLYEQFGVIISCDGVLKCPEIANKVKEAIANVDRILIAAGEKGYKENEKNKDMDINVTVMDQVNSRSVQFNDPEYATDRKLEVSVSATQEEIEKVLLEEVFEFKSDKEN